VSWSPPAGELPNLEYTRADEYIISGVLSVLRLLALVLERGATTRQVVEALEEIHAFLDDLLDRLYSENE
jgi:hypothetical protein